MRRALIVSIVSVLACAGCRPAAVKTPPAALEAPPVRGHSHAQPERVRVTHVSLALGLDFAARVLRGQATLRLTRADPAAPLVLDVQALRVHRVVGDDGGARAFTLGREDPKIGGALVVTLSPRDSFVRIDYETTPEGPALQWLSPAQTRDGKAPFLFTQGESILTRSWIPLQDAPDVRVTYDAAVRAPAGLTVLMSAEPLGRGADGVWRFRMAQPIPPYLVALAAGVLSFAPLSARAGVWAEPSLVAAARTELAATESMIAAAETLFGPYRWGRYDVLVLPPAFPFGGMENPRLTFATPTILAGDGSLVGVVAHELAHSWSGNLVTNATWSDFWLNEGFTVYCQQRIMERVFGPERALVEKALERADLEEELQTLEPWQQILHIDLRGRNPDEGFSGVPYEKGALLLERLEEIFGRPAFDRFLRRHFDEHAFGSVTTTDFVRAVKRDLFAGQPEKAAQIDLALWLERPGLPADAPRFRSPALERSAAEADRFARGAAADALDTKGWVTQQWQHFLKALPADVPPARLAALDAAFGFTASRNVEILCDWLVLATKRGYRNADARVEALLLEVGRRKYLQPLYTALAETPEGRTRARAIYARARPRYHAIARHTIDEILAKADAGR